MSYPNQKIIYIQRSSDKVPSNYLKVSNDNLSKAVFDLSQSAFILWIYLCSNKDGYKKELYPSDFEKCSKLSISTYRRALKELIDKGYVIQSLKQKNIYKFQETGNSYYDRLNDYNSDTIKIIDLNDFNAFF